MSDPQATDQHCAHGFYFPGGCLYCANTEIDRLRRDLEIQAVNAAAVLQAQRERDDHRVRLREAIEIIRSKATSSEWEWTIEVEGEIAADDVPSTTTEKTK